MRQEVSAYTDAKTNLLSLFRCEPELPVKVMVDAKWRLEENGGVFFLHYEPQPDRDSLVSVIVNKGGEPWITESGDLTMIVAIDCIKFAFILKNSLKA